ncbi:uncharacterized protein MKK02DRAFT_29476 [Dioszegia hungarica]|uniref:Probable 26S proteasome regulatory subunit p27 n=1 Tax=Dioszegia hungarica TaxID=4972 RepID=A0AA38LX77_9TREE|nr:uncharacterized protein MKK02DRAFT_29476 [Dioszegia hungarica]KAI9639405.1 hypothetical protein MKK02DRAFT_29476 [Dioszegia hungarica]
MALPVPTEFNPTTLPLPHPDAYPGEPREFAMALMQRKDEIEKEIDTLKDILASYAIRHARAALARLYNDRQAVVDLLAPALEAAFDAPEAPSSSGSGPMVNGVKPNGHVTEPSATASASTSTSRTVPTASEQSAWPERAVARVNSVAPGSPAEDAGLQAGDMIYSFGEVSSTTSGGLQAVGALVAHSEGVSIPILVERQSPAGIQRISLGLTPRNGWGGRGSLGCHILPA